MCVCVCVYICEGLYIIGKVSKYAYTDMSDDTHVTANTHMPKHVTYTRMPIYIYIYIYIYIKSYAYYCIYI